MAHDPFWVNQSPSWDSELGNRECVSQSSVVEAVSHEGGSCRKPQRLPTEQKLILSEKEKIDRSRAEEYILLKFKCSVSHFCSSGYFPFHYSLMVMGAASEASPSGFKS